MGKVLAVCTSEKKGTQKKEQDQIECRINHGIVGDAHAGNWHRQISLLSFEKFDAFKKQGADIDYGAFGENIILEGFDLGSLPVGTRFRLGEVLLEISQIGKACHHHCAIYHKMGDCIMPREGVFAIVLEEGVIKKGDDAICMEADPNRPFTAAVITLSDRAFHGDYEDKSGPVIVRMLGEEGYDIKEQLILPDGKEELSKELKRLADQRQINVIFTTGGTGFSVRDLTPEATMEVSDRIAPGIAEGLRQHSASITKRAWLSRQTAGIRGRTLIVNLPGSPKACKENLEFLLPILPHGIGILRGTDTD